MVYDEYLLWKDRRISHQIFSEDHGVFQSSCSFRLSSYESCTFENHSCHSYSSNSHSLAFSFTVLYPEEKLDCPKVLEKIKQANSNLKISCIFNATCSKKVMQHKIILITDY